MSIPPDMPTEPLDALVFDLGGVIVAHDNAMRDARLATRCRSSGTAEDVRRIAEQPRWQTGQGSAEALHEELRDRLGYDGDWTDFKGDWCCHFAIDASMLRFVEALSRRHRVLLFSNTEKVHWDFLVAASGGALAAFEAYLSYEMGLAKPEVAAFDAVAAKAGIRPARSLFIDDRSDNVEGARMAGFQAEVFTSQATLVDALAARGAS